MIEIRPLTSAEIAARDGHPVARHPAARHAAAPPSRAETMAMAMLDIAATGDGACRDCDLALRGFTPEDLRRHGPEAAHIALRRSGGGTC